MKRRYPLQILNHTDLLFFDKAKMQILAEGSKEVEFKPPNVQPLAQHDRVFGGIEDSVEIAKKKTETAFLKIGIEDPVMAPPLTSEYGEDFYDRRDEAAANELGTERNDLDEDSGDNDSQAGSLDNVNVDNVEIDPNMEAVQIL